MVVLAAVSAMQEVAVLEESSPGLEGTAGWKGFVCSLHLRLAQATLNLTPLSHSQCLETLKLFSVFIIHIG